MSLLEKAMIFIDGSNVFHCCKDLDFEISYEKILPILKKGKNVRRVYFYTGIKPEEEKRFIKMLGHLEIDIFTKLLKVRPAKCKNCGKKTKRYVEKGIDAKMSTDILWHGFKENYDTAIIVSSDADFIPPIEIVKLLGRRVELWAFKHALGKELKRKADKIIYINEIIDKIKKD